MMMAFVRQRIVSIVKKDSKVVKRWLTHQGFGSWVLREIG
jgi:hypothetical protein